MFTKENLVSTLNVHKFLDLHQELKMIDISKLLIEYNLDKITIPLRYENNSDNFFYKIIKAREKRDGQELIISKLIFESCNLCHGSLSSSEDKKKKFCSKCGVWG